MQNGKYIQFHCGNTSSLNDTIKFYFNTFTDYIYLAPVFAKLVVECVIPACSECEFETGIFLIQIKNFE